MQVSLEVRGTKNYVSKKSKVYQFDDSIKAGKNEILMHIGKSWLGRGFFIESTRMEVLD